MTATATGFSGIEGTTEHVAPARRPDPPAPVSQPHNGLGLRLPPVPLWNKIVTGRTFVSTDRLARPPGQSWGELLGWGAYRATGSSPQNRSPLGGRLAGRGDYYPCFGTPRDEPPRLPSSGGSGGRSVRPVWGRALEVMCFSMTVAPSATAAIAAPMPMVPAMSEYRPTRMSRARTEDAIFLVRTDQTRGPHTMMRAVGLAVAVLLLTSCADNGSTERPSPASTRTPSSLPSPTATIPEVTRTPERGQTSSTSEPTRSPEREQTSSSSEPTRSPGRGENTFAHRDDAGTDPIVSSRGGPVADAAGDGTDPHRVIGTRGAHVADRDGIHSCPVTHDLCRRSSPPRPSRTARPPGCGGCWWRCWSRLPWPFRCW